MEKSLLNVLDNKEENYIFPFFWQHGEDEEVLREYMEKIQKSNIKAICVEARPHPDFAEKGWWHDLDIIMDEAKKRNMKVWVLDDSHFPTGYANGMIKEKYPDKAKLYLNEKHVDMYGPMPEITLNVKKLLGEINYWEVMESFAPFDMKERVKYDDEKLICVVAAKFTEGEKFRYETINITDKVNGKGILHWSIPEGAWRIFLIYTTKNGGGSQNYINIIDKESVKVQIEAVYEPHYKKYKDDFGKTFAGFFSDEPSFGNVAGYDFNSSIGRKRMVLPWNKEVSVNMEKEFKENFSKALLALRYEIGSENFVSYVRYKYMDIITKLYEKNFSNQLGNWCRERGVEYIGHIIEDMNAHARLGCGPGHFFRSMSGQDMSGIDLIGTQVLPGSDSYGHAYYMGSSYDGIFNHFALGKLGSSYAHIDPLKKGRSMCEIFGAYGWNEGIKLMKWLSDHMLVRGINHFVPHAFSPKEFPDPDCPPHFYARGKNPQYRYFGILMKYINKVCHIFSDGIHVSKVAILYHAESEWSGEYMLCQEPAAELARNQIDYDFIPADVFKEREKYKFKESEKYFCVNNEKYEALVIPYSQRIPSHVLEFIRMNKDVNVIFIKALPVGVSDLLDDNTKLVSMHSNIKVLELKKLAIYLREKNIYDIEISTKEPYLRYYHYKKGDNDYYMFFNEEPSRTINTKVTIPIKGYVARYDVFENTLYSQKFTEKKNKIEIPLKLTCYESTIIIISKDKIEGTKKPNKKFKKEMLINKEWKVSLASAEEYPNFKFFKTMKELKSITSIKPEFSGTIKYETELLFEENFDEVILEIDQAFEATEVFLNSKKVGVKLCQPYRFDISKHIHKGNNKIEIEVTNTLAHSQQNVDTRFSRSEMLEPSGIIGKVHIKY